VTVLGIVTKASLLARQALDPAIRRHRYIFFPLKSALFLCEDHGQLTGNVHFQDNLLLRSCLQTVVKWAPRRVQARPEGGL